MYSEKVKLKVEKMFKDLRNEAQEIIVDTNSADEAVNRICQLVNSETSSRSKSMLSDMLFDLNDLLLQTSFFENTVQQNKFVELNLRQEILSKYQFTASTVINYQEASRIMESIKIGGVALAIGGTCAIGVVLIAGLSFSSLVILPVGMLFAAAFGATMINYFLIEPNRSKMNLSQEVDKYLVEAQQQFFIWLDEIESFFNKRVDEFKQTF